MTESNVTAIDLTVVKENAQAEDLTVNTISPELPPGFMKHEHVFLRHAPAFRDSCDHSMSGDVDIGSSQPGDTVSMEGGVMPLGPMVSEMTHSDEVVQAAEEFERRSRRMKEHLTVKVVVSYWFLICCPDKRIAGCFCIILCYLFSLILYWINYLEERGWSPVEKGIRF